MGGRAGTARILIGLGVAPGGRPCRALLERINGEDGFFATDISDMDLAQVGPLLSSLFAQETLEMLVGASCLAVRRCSHLGRRQPAACRCARARARGSVLPAARGVLPSPHPRHADVVRPVPVGPPAAHDRRARAA